MGIGRHNNKRMNSGNILYCQMDNLLDKTFWYDRTVFEIISDGMPIAELARKTNISYYSLYFTYKRVKDLIKNNIEWD